MLRVVILLSCIAGVLYCIEDRFQVLRVREVSFESLALVSDDFFWSRIDPESHRYWPVLLYRSGRIKNRIMSEAPVSMNLILVEPGSFKASFVPLEPWFMVFWSGGEWFLSNEGHMWSVHHAMNSIISQQAAREGPVIVWGEGLPDPISSGVDIEVSVADSVIPIHELESWKKVLEETGFYRRISSITINRREGKRLVEILERSADGSVRILLNDTSADWPPLLRAVDDILSQSGISGKNLIVDTTYSGKILVRVIS